MAEGPKKNYRKGGVGAGRGEPGGQLPPTLPVVATSATSATSLLDQLVAQEGAKYFDRKDLKLVKDYGNGLIAFANKDGTRVAIFAKAEGEKYYSISGWQKHKTKSLEEVADSMI